MGSLNLAAELSNISRACKVTGFSHDTFYRYQAAVKTRGVEAPIDTNRRKPNIKNHVEEMTEAAVRAFLWSNRLLARFMFLTSRRLVRLFPDISFPSELAYYIIYRPECASLPKLMSFRNWLLAEVV